MALPLTPVAVQNAEIRAAAANTLFGGATRQLAIGVPLRRRDTDLRSERWYFNWFTPWFVGLP